MESVGEGRVGEELVAVQTLVLLLVRRGRQYGKVRGVELGAEVGDAFSVRPAGIDRPLPFELDRVPDNTM